MANRLSLNEAPRQFASPAAASPAWQRFLPSLPLIVGLVACVPLMAGPAGVLNDPDTYLHIAAGRWMIAHGALPFRDPFSHSMPQAAWVPAEWLAEIILYAVYAAAHSKGLIVLTAASYAATLVIVTRFLLRRVDPLAAMIPAMATAALLLPHVLSRPHILALPCLALWSGALLAARDDGRDPPFVLLPLMALWANLHGSFMFGVALAIGLGGEAVLLAPDFGSRRHRAWRWSGFVLLAVLAALLTPNGVAGLLQPFRLIAMPALQSSFIEWMSPNFQNNPPLELWVLGIAGLGFATGARLPISRLVLLLALLHMTLHHVRHADLLAVVGPLAVAAPLGAAIRARIGGAAESRLAQVLARLARPAALPGVAVALAAAAMLALPLAWHPISRADDPETPSSALAAAAKLGLHGPVFNAELFGGYLVFRGVPTFIDGRIEMYGNDFLARYVAAQQGNARVLGDILDRYHITWTLLPPQLGAVAVLDHLPGWRRAYADLTAVIDVRIDKKP